MDPAAPSVHATRCSCWGLRSPVLRRAFASYAAALSSAKRVGLSHAGRGQGRRRVQACLSRDPGKQGLVGRKQSFDRPRRRGGRVERLAPLAEELVRSRVDLVVTGGHITTLAAAEQPIRFLSSSPVPCSSPSSRGSSRSYARPGRSVIGAAISHGEITGKRLAYLKQLVPSANRLAWLLHDNWTRMDRLSGGSIDVVALLSEVARTAGFETRFFPFSTETDLATAFDDVDAWRPQASLHPWRASRRRANSQAWPFVANCRMHSQLREAVDAGGLLSYSAQAFTVRLSAQFAASYVDRILRGANPPRCPSSLLRATTSSSTRGTAEAFGLSIPQALLVSAGSSADRSERDYSRTAGDEPVRPRDRPIGGHRSRRGGYVNCCIRVFAARRAP